MEEKTDRHVIRDEIETAIDAAQAEGCSVQFIWLSPDYFRRFVGHYDPGVDPTFGHFQSRNGKSYPMAQGGGCEAGFYLSVRGGQ